VHGITSDNKCSDAKIEQLIYDEIEISRLSGVHPTVTLRSQPSLSGKLYFEQARCGLLGDIGIAKEALITLCRSLECMCGTDVDCGLCSVHTKSSVT
jgi:hypothetical protein